MIRVIAVVLVAAISASWFGVDRPALAAQNDASHLQVIVTRVAKYKIGDIVKGERVDGTKFEGVLVAKMPDSITLDVYRRRTFRRDQRLGSETVALVDVKVIKRPMTRTERALLVSGVAVGACAVAGAAIAADLDSRPDEQP